MPDVGLLVSDGRWAQVGMPILAIGHTMLLGEAVRSPTS